MRTHNFEIEVIYSRPSDSDLNARLDVTAEKSGGTFLSFIEEQDLSGEAKSRRKYGFDDEELADDFQEEANFAISRHFSFEPIELDEVPSRIRWDFSEAIYHHIEFGDVKSALRFASWFRAVFGTYMEPEMFDIFVVKPVDAQSGYMVIWAFPMESVIPDANFSDELDDELEEVLSMVNSKKDKKKVMN